MSTKIASISNTGKRSDTPLDITQMCCFNESAGLQITQGESENGGLGYIQLSRRDAYLLIIALSKWIKATAKADAEKLARTIDELKIEKGTRLGEAVECERFIGDLDVIKIPLFLLGDDTLSTNEE